MEIFKYVNTLIGLAVVMLLLSPLVSAVTQVCMWVFDSRAAHLQAALKKLLLQLNGDAYGRLDSPASPTALSDKAAEELAKSILLHPMVARTPLWLIFRYRRGEVVEREELIHILLELARDPETFAGRQLSLLLADQNADNSFAVKVDSWFHRVMERTTAEYRLRAQLLTIVGAGLVAWTFQTDSIELLKSLSSDGKLRDSLVRQAEQEQTHFEQLAQAAPSSGNQHELDAAGLRRSEIETTLAEWRDSAIRIFPEHFLWEPLPQARLRKNPRWSPPFSRTLELVVGAEIYSLEPRWTSDPLADIDAAIQNSGAPVTTRKEVRLKSDDLILRSHRFGLLQLRSAPGKAESNMLDRSRERWCETALCCDEERLRRSWRGVLLTWVLLSLGAPFWYDMLKDLLKLRSSLAGKEESSRQKRQAESA
jgi:hypothetical protein